MKITTTQLKHLVQETVKKQLDEEWSTFDAHLRNLGAYGISPTEVTSQLIDMLPPDKVKALLKTLASPGYGDNMAFFQAFKATLGDKKASQVLHMILNRAKKK